MGYAVAISFSMIVALVDISDDYQKQDSPRWSERTLDALRRRELITGGPTAKTKLTKKGKAYLSMALFEYASAEAAIAPRYEKMAA